MLRYLLDEDLRGPLWLAIQHHNLRTIHELDVVRVGDADAPGRGSPDPQILVWTQSHDRILISRDKSTLPAHLQQHLANGDHCPGIFLVRRRATFASVIDFLVLAAHASDAEEWRDRIEFIW